MIELLWATNSEPRFEAREPKPLARISVFRNLDRIPTGFASRRNLVWGVGCMVCRILPWWILVCLLPLGCRFSQPPRRTPSAQGLGLVGKWSSTDDLRQYTFDSLGRFSMSLQPQACRDAPPTAHTLMASGTWEMQDKILLLELSRSPDEEFASSKLIEVLDSLGRDSMLLRSAVVLCGKDGPESVRLRRVW